ncbi:acyltransferase [Pseudomonas sp. TMW22090]|uniref:acyltransferase family protein n=1 Tax=Pseudomonas sp. TMW22090 TaxID=2506434 RepID=UPI001F1083E7|nr:acyltransferase [Pseudomonas sp. TMW22090]MCH4880461.1 acyltransferase [Pseudomonas sp. TMW22090]
MKISKLLHETYNTTGGSDKYDSIQVLRFIAALAVVICHSAFYAQERLDPASFRYGPGSNGVSLFFVISGFVMILASEKLQGTADGWKHFATRRLARIVPLYWIATTIKVAVLITATHFVLHADIDWLYIIKSYFFIPAINIDNQIKPLLGVGWTLLFEMFFYTTFTACLFFKINAIRFCAGFFFLLSLASFFKTEDWPPAFYFYADPYVLNFLWGMLAARLIQQHIYMPKYIAIISITFSLAYLFLPRTTEWGGTIPYGIASLLTVYGCASLEKTSRISMPKVFVWLGAASYSIYLFHPLLSPAAPEILKRVGLISPSVSVLLSILIAIVAGSIFYVLIENPATLKLNQLIKKHLKKFTTHESSQKKHEVN